MDVSGRTSREDREGQEAGNNPFVGSIATPNKTGVLLLTWKGGVDVGLAPAAPPFTYCPVEEPVGDHHGSSPLLYPWLTVQGVVSDGSSFLGVRGFSETSLLGLQAATLLLPPHMAVPLCMSVSPSSQKDTSQIGVGPPQ